MSDKPIENHVHRLCACHVCGANLPYIETEMMLLRAALEPFARFADRYPDARPDLIVLSLQDPRVPVTMGDMHRAKEALKNV